MTIYEIFRTVFIAGAVISVLMLLISVFLFLFWDIPMLIGELTGANAKKGIAQIQDKIVQSVANNQTGKLSRTGYQSSASSRIEKDITQKIITEELYLSDSVDETALLEFDETSLLGQPQDETGLLYEPQTDETALLENISGNSVSMSSYTGTCSPWNNSQASDTMLLNNTVKQNSIAQHASSIYAANTDPDFQIECEITYIHTDEKIC